MVYRLKTVRVISEENLEFHTIHKKKVTFFIRPLAL